MCNGYYRKSVCSLALDWIDAQLCLLKAGDGAGIHTLTGGALKGAFLGYATTTVIFERTQAQTREPQLVLRSTNLTVEIAYSNCFNYQPED